MTVAVEAWARDRHGDEARQVTQARFTFVAVDEDRKPRVIGTPSPPEGEGGARRAAVGG